MSIEYANFKLANGLIVPLATFDQFDHKLRLSKITRNSVKIKHHTKQQATWEYNVLIECLNEFYHRPFIIDTQLALTIYNPHLDNLKLNFFTKEGDAEILHFIKYDISDVLGISETDSFVSYNFECDVSAI